jgi:phosphomannomutase/phosphoglucomutase
MLIKLAAKPYPSWKAVVDLGNGAQSEIIPKVLEKLNLKVIAINNTPIPEKFMARDTEAGETFGELANLITTNKADFGIVFDADGDRVVFIDKTGQFIPGDYTGALIAKDAPTRSVVTPINTSQVVEYLGKKVYRTRVGSPFVVQKMKDTGAGFGFEANGGGIFPEIMMSRDGGSTTIKILNLMKKTKKSLGQLVGELPKFYLYKTKVDCPWELNLRVLQVAKEKIKGVKIEELDGLKIWIDKLTWILFRASANAPEFRVFAEAKDERKAKELAEEGMNLVKSVIKGNTN